MQPGSRKARTAFFRFMAMFLVVPAYLFSCPPGIEAATDLLWLSSMPRQEHADKAHGQTGQKRGSRGSGGQAHDGHESEHRPQPVRTYWLNTCQISDKAEAFVTHPEGAAEPVAIERDGHEASVTIKTPLGEGPVHGANNVYLIDRSVEDGALVITTAKWLTIHHNCGWGHDHKFDQARQEMQPFDKAPLEIVADRLWDCNFHSNVMSGDLISFQVLSFGQPAAKASVVIESDQGWQKKISTDQEGRGSFQLVRDYYPDSWQLFDRAKRGELRMTARYQAADSGQYEGQAFDRTQMSSTFSWRYYPARRDYSSYSFGLLIGVLAMTVSGVGVYAYRERRKKPFKITSLDEHE